MPPQGRLGHARVVLDDGTVFRIRPADLRTLEVASGAVVTGDLLERLQHSAAASRGMEIAYRLLAVRLRSRRELADRLGRRGVPPGTIEELLAELSRRGLIDDARFADAWVRGRLALHPSGAARLRQELLRKGVGREVVDQAVSSALADRGDSELALALAVAGSRAARYRGLPRKVQYRRLGALLQRRGFSAGVIAQVLRNVVASQDNRAGADAGS